jgi:hypothetical protein
LIHNQIHVSDNTNDQTNEWSAFLETPKDGERQSSPFLNRVRETVRNIKDRIKTHFHGGEAEIAKETGDALTYIAEQTITESGSGSAETTEAIVAAELETVDDRLDANRAENPVARLVNDGLEDDAVGGVMALAEAGDEAVAETVARDIDYAEAIKQMRETGESSYKVFLIEPPPAPERTYGLTDGEWREVQARFDADESWSSERRELHGEIVEKFIAQAEALSVRLMGHDPEPTIYALRGAPGAGKTTALRQGNEMFAGILDEDGQPAGAIAPDIFKIPLMAGGGISHSQIHDKSSVIARKIDKTLTHSDISVVYDKLMNYPGNIEDMITNAQETERKVKVLDVDVPLELSAVRVLCRKKGGDDPLVPFKMVSEAFIGIRRNRRELFSQLESNAERVSGYVLMGYDFASQSSVEIARFEDGKVVIASGREPMADIAAPASDEIIAQETAMVQDQIITEEYIEYFAKNYFASDEKSQQYAASTAAVLRGFMGKTIAEALDEKAGIKQ